MGKEILVPLTEERKALLDDVTYAKTFNWLLQRLRKTFGERLYRPDVMDVVTNCYTRTVMSALRSFDPSRGVKKFSNWLMSGVDRHFPDYLRRVWRALYAKRRAKSIETMWDGRSFEDDGNNHPIDQCRRSGSSGYRRNGVTKCSAPRDESPSEFDPRRLDVLSKTERSVILDRFSGKTLDEVGLDHDRDRFWCRRVEARALEKLGALK